MSVDIMIGLEENNCFRMADTNATINMSNYNTRVLFNAIGIDATELYGHLTSDQLPSKVQALLRLANSFKARAPFTEPAYEINNFIYGGVLDMYIERRATELLTLFKRAIDDNLLIYWS